MEVLTADIENEEERAGIRDLADPGLPGCSRGALRARRENIGATVASLESLVHEALKVT
jgi:hypothetical protein